MESGWKRHFAVVLGISRTSFYRKPHLQASKDQVDIKLLKEAHESHPYYGVCRLSLELGWSEKKTRRIRTLAEVVVLRPTKKHRRGRTNPAEIMAPTNALSMYATPKNPGRPQDSWDYSGMTESGGWVQDFTHLWFDRSWCYLAVVLDLKTRQVTGWRLGLRHSAELTFSALLDALSRHAPPTILHSDQGSEYLSFKHQKICNKLGITLSCSTKSSPWQNGFMERFFLTLKTELGALNQYHDLAELHEAIALTIHYYNTKRIHTALKTTPANYAARLSLDLERVLQKTVG